jgi:hypothetical protein
MSTDDPKFWEQIKYFQPREWGKDPGKAAPALVLALDRAREMARCPIIIHVCWDTDGHSERSYHYTGQAVDFHFADQPGMSCIREFAVLAAQPELGAIGFYPGWEPRPGWHVDLRDWTDGRLYWSRTNGIYKYGLMAL